MILDALFSAIDLYETFDDAPTESPKSATTPPQSSPDHAHPSNPASSSGALGATTEQPLNSVAMRVAPPYPESASGPLIGLWIKYEEDMAC
jgi:hypothetical protein